jgi:hypothetical protein
MSTFERVCRLVVGAMLLAGALLTAEGIAEWITTATTTR